MGLDGMGILLKSLGINPDQLQQGMALAEGKIAAIEQSLLRIESKLDRVCLWLSVMNERGVFENGGNSSHQD